MKYINNNRRVFARNASVSNNTHETCLNNNDLILGPPGSGKTTGYVIPNILNTYGSYIITDVKGSMYKTYAPYLRSKGYSVRLIDFSDLKNSCAYNPLDYVEYNSPTDYCEQDVIKLAKVLTPVKSHEDPFWEESACNVITSLIAYVLEALPESEHTMINVLEVFKVLSTEKGKKMFDTLRMENRHSYAVKIYDTYKNSMEAEKMWSSICQFVTNALWLFDFRESARVFGKKSDFDFRELGERESAFFVNISDTDSSMATIINIFYHQAFSTLCRLADSKENSRLDVPCRIFFDDCCAYKLPDFDKIMNCIRSREISASLVLQNLSQLDSIYGQSAADSIKAACDTILYLGGQDIRTAEYMSYRVKKSVETVLDMPIDKAYLLTRGKHAQSVEKIRPGDNTLFLKKYYSQKNDHKTEIANEKQYLYEKNELVS